MKKVFISSTTRDLLGHRQEVEESVRQLDMYPVTQADSTNRPGLDLAGADIFIAIIAYRYGYVPEGKTQSLVELSYEEAVRRGLPRLIYLVDPAYPWPTALKEAGKRDAAYDPQTELSRFKSRLHQYESPRVFTTPDDLASKVMEDVSLLLAAPTASAHKPSVGVASPDDQSARRLILIGIGALALIVIVIAALILTGVLR